VDRARATRVLVGLLGFAFLVSVIHYTDNYVNYDEYPQSDDLPAPSATVVAVSWFLFTASGALGLWMWVRGRVTAAAAFLAGYSVSGLIGFAHYAVPGATGMVWWRQTHVVVDICCGIAVFCFAIWAERNAERLSPPPPSLGPAPGDGRSRASAGRPPGTS
jgi:hypothetical protein